MSTFDIHEAFDRPFLLRAMEQAFHNAKAATHKAAGGELQRVALNVKLANSIRQHASGVGGRVTDPALEDFAVDLLTFMAIVDAGFHPAPLADGGFAATPGARSQASPKRRSAI